MDDVRGDVLRPPQGTTPASVIANENKNRDPLRATGIFMRYGTGIIMVSATYASSVTLKIWQHGVKEDYCNFATLKKAINTKTSSSQKGLNISNFGWFYFCKYMHILQDKQSILHNLCIYYKEFRGKSKRLLVRKYI